MIIREVYADILAKWTVAEAGARRRAGVPRLARGPDLLPSDVQVHERVGPILRWRKPERTLGRIKEAITGMV